MYVCNIVLRIGGCWILLTSRGEYMQHLCCYMLTHNTTAILDHTSCCVYCHTIPRPSAVLEVMPVLAEQGLFRRSTGPKTSWRLWEASHTWSSSLACTCARWWASWPGSMFDDGSIQWIRAFNGGKPTWDLHLYPSAGVAPCWHMNSLRLSGWSCH